MSVTQATLLGDTFGSQASGTIPVGGIIMWSGTIATIPTGWALCDGSNSTPDLRNRFIVGATASTGDTTYPGLSVGATGGSADASLVSHSHSVTYISNPGNHYHGPSTQGGFDNDGNAEALRVMYEDGPPFAGIVWDLGGGAHTHDITLSNEGASASNANLPPYFALAFIMRVS